MLVTERGGSMRIATRDGKLSPPLRGVPKVMSQNQGGLLDVIVDRDFATNNTIYFCYSDPVDGGAQTALARARLDAGATPQLTDVRRIFRQEGPPSRGLHFGCRIVQARDGNLFLTTGDHGSASKSAQTLDNHIGKMIRIAPDGSVPKDNPFVGRADAKPEIWSYGHRNSQGATLHPVTGKLWMHEHGPQGGDEINIPEAGKNYGWPVIGFGVNYGGAKIHEGTQQGRHGAADPAMDAGDRAVRLHDLHRRSVPAMEGQCLHRRLADANAGAARTRRRESHARGTHAAPAQRAHPRRAHRARTARCGWSPTIRRGASCG